MDNLKKYLDTFNPLSIETWNKVKILFSEKALAKEAHFIDDNQVAKQIAFLEKGIVRAYYRNNEGKEYNKHFSIAPSFIGGYASLITGRKNSINQQALTECKIWVADFDRLSALYEKCRDLEFVARKWAERQFVEKEQREIELVMLDADKRYAMLQEQFADLEQLIPQYHIASYLGITATQLSRIRKKFSVH